MRAWRLMLGSLSAALAVLGNPAVAATAQPAAARRIALAAPGTFDRTGHATWRTLAVAGNARLADPRVGVYVRPGRLNGPALLFVPDVGMAVAQPGPRLPCHGDTVLPPAVERFSAVREASGAGYAVDTMVDCGSGPVLYPLVRGGRRLLLDRVDAYVDAFNATEGAAPIEDFAWVKLHPASSAAGGDTELPAAVQGRLFRSPLTMTVLAVQVQAREISMPMAGLPPRAMPGHRITATVDRGAADRLYVGLQLWRVDRCLPVRLTAVEDHSASLEIDLPGDPSSALAVGTVLSTSSQPARSSGPCR